FDYELVLMMAADHGLAGRECINAGELAHETLLTFPVPQERLDVYSQFLRPAGVSPRQSTMESLDIMIQMVALGRGLTVLPDWLAHSYRYQLPVATARLGEHGVM